MTLGKKRLFLAAFIFTVCFSIYLVGVFIRVLPHAGIPPKWTPRAFLPSEKLGHVPNAGMLATNEFMPGRTIPVRFDDRGFRVPEPPPAAKDGDTMLFLGGSFTMGYGVWAEDAWAHESGELLGVNALNGGVPSWGLGHMVMHARDIVPEVKPDILVVQYSGWLVDRALSFYMPTFWAKLPGPYLYDGADGIDVHAPVAMTYGPEIEEARAETTSALGLFFKVGVPLYLHDDWMTIRVATSALVGRTPFPSQNRKAAVTWVFEELDRIAADAGSELVVLIVPGSPGERELEPLPSGLRVIDTRPHLLDSLPDPSRETWDENYAFWHDGEIVDRHPNELMHERIAEVIARELR